MNETIEAKTILSATGGFLGSFDYSLNPYSGCRFACSYCYAAAWVYDRELRQSWGRWARVKQNAAALLEKAGRQGKLDGKRIYMSSVTDPYQPQEAKSELSRACLEVMLRYPPGLLVVQTRSPLVVRDIDLFQQLGDRVLVAMTIGTDDEAVRRIVEPSCAPIVKRLGAIRQVKQAGVRTQASVAPLLPCHPDRLADLLDGSVERVVVSTFHDDGGGGSKTRAAAYQLYREHGWEEEWLGVGYERPVVDGLRRRLGEIVSVGRTGFNLA